MFKGVTLGRELVEIVCSEFISNCLLNLSLRLCIH